jgi:hypothetical protein
MRAQCNLSLDTGTGRSPVSADRWAGGPAPVASGPPGAAAVCQAATVTVTETEGGGARREAPAADSDWGRLGS